MLGKFWKVFKSLDNFTKVIIVTLLLILLSIPFITGNSQIFRSRGQLVAPLPRLKTLGNNIQTEGGATVVLRGVNILRSEWTNSMNFERQAFPILSQWKANVVLRGFAADPVNNSDPTYLSFLDEEQQLAESNNMYIIYVFRSAAVNGDQPIAPDDNAQNALVKLAGRYKDKTNVMYGLAVEPHDVSWSTLLPRFNSMVSAIRNASSPHKPIIMVPGTQWGRDVHWAITQPVTADSGINIVYKSHPYDASSLFQQEFLDTYNANLPVFLGEFGTGTQMTQSDVDTLLKLTRDRNISWAAWLFDSEGCPCIISDRTSFSPTSPYGISVKNETLSTLPILTDTITIAPTPINTPIPTPTPTPIPGSVNVIDTILPIVSITSPLNGGRVKRNSSVNIQVNASDNIAVTKVKISVNGSILCEDTTLPYSCYFRVPRGTGVTYLIRADAYDSSNNQSFQTISVTSYR